jgi:outer membrane protein OmpA-like peptidoglycan-associated protein
MSAGCSVSAIAQNTNTSGGSQVPSPRWSIDINLLGGMANQSFKTANTTANYPNAINSNTGNLTYSKGYSFGADAELGFFFGKKRHFGLGTGAMFMEQHGEATLTNFHMDYRAVDGAGNVFRHVLTGSDVKEDVISSMVNIPIVLKYKDRFSKHWGFSVDAGALLNVQMRNSYNTHATFDQGSIYKFVQNTDGGTTSVYDNAETPSTSDWLITKAEFLRNNPNGNWQEYASIKRSMGINAGDVLLTGNRRGNNRFNTGSIGFIIQPSLNYYLSDNVALNFGGYYMMQPFTNNAQRGYRLTDGSGSYSSVLNNVTSSTNNAYGLNIGAKFLIGRTNKDRDHDGVLDKNDKCPDVFGLAQFDGCPDTDKDGIPDYKDSCISVWGLAAFAGCPDTDADGIPDKEDECPLLAGPRKLNGCPDRDNDGIADKNDQCPDSFGLVEFHGCPDTDGDGVPNNEDNCPLAAGPASNHGCPIVPDTKDGTSKGDMNTPILFEVNMTTIYRGSIPTIEDAVNELNKDKNATITIDGHADSSGPEPANKVLSLNRANAVKSELTQRGINPNRLKTIGHGSQAPAATNSTYEGKEQNRRAKMKLHPSK